MSNDNIGGATTIAALETFVARHDPHFVMHIPDETSYEEMVRKYEAGDKGMLQTMRFVLKPGVSAEDELARWKQYARDERAELRDTVPVTFFLEAPPSEADLEAFAEYLDGASPALLEFYRRHEGGALFVHGPDGDDGLFFLPIEEMERARVDILDWYDGDDEETVEETDGDGILEIMGVPDWFESAVTFGMVGAAAERFLIPTEGPHRGAVFMFDHDPLGMRRLAPSFEDFIEWLMTEPTKAAELTGLHGAASYQAGP